MIEIMRKRKSWRTFENKPVDQDTRAALERFIKENSVTPFGTKVRFMLIDTTAEDAEMVKHLGTYGTIEGASLFLAGCAEKTPAMYPDFGYAMENNILYAEQLGLNTCWMGVTFDKAGFAGKMKLSENEELVACTPVGYAKNKRRLKDLAMRRFVSSDSRLKHEKLFFNNSPDIPLDMNAAGNFKEALECVRLAPSASNRQPWRVIRHEGTGNTFSLFLEYTEGYRYKYGQLIDMGIAMLHFELACREKGIAGGWVRENAAPVDAGSMEYMATWK